VKYDIVDEKLEIKVKGVAPIDFNDVQDG